MGGKDAHKGEALRERQAASKVRLSSVTRLYAVMRVADGPTLQFYIQPSL
jgi:hypothetical protein